MSLHYLGKYEPRKLCAFSHTVSRKRHCFGLLYLRQPSTNFNNFYKVLAMQFELS